MKLSEKIKIVEIRTGKTVISNTAIVLFNSDLLSLNNPENELEVYIGKLNTTDNQTGYFRWKIGANEIVTMPLNQTGTYPICKEYDNLIFTRFDFVSVNDDTEIIFSGHKFVLQ